jgi:hypothetical protein
LYQTLREAYVAWQDRADAAVMYEAVQAFAGNIEYDRDLPMRENVDCKPYFDYSARYISMIEELLRSKGIRFMVASYPYGVLVNEREWSVGRRLRGFDSKVYPSL